MSFPSGILAGRELQCTHSGSSGLTWQEKYRSAFLGLLALLLIASLFLLHRHGPVDERPTSPQPADAVPFPTRDIATDVEAVADRSSATREPASLDLRSASEVFRNSTMLFAIRRAGFYCADVVSTDETTEDVWLAGCSDTIRYIVAVRGAERFDVHPVAYGDAVAPVPERDRSSEPRSLEPRPLRQ